MISQVAAEAAKSSSVIFLDGVAVMAFIGFAGLVAREYYRAKRSKKNGNGNGKIPGTAQICIDAPNHFSVQRMMGFCSPGRIQIR